MEHQNLNSLIISESNYSCQFLDEPYMKMKNNIIRQIYQLDEKEKDIYEQQEELGKKMLELISNNQKKFKHKYNMIQKQDDLNHKEYNYFNNKIINILNHYKNNSDSYNNNNSRNSYINNGSTLNFNPIFDAFDNNWVFPKKNDVLNNKSFKEKYNLKSYEKKMIKTKTNSNKNLLRRNYPRSKSKTYRTNRKSTSLNPFNTNNNIRVNKNDNSNKKISKTERKPKYEYNINSKSNKKYKFREKSGTRRTTVRTDNTSIFDGNNKLDFDDKDDNNKIYKDFHDEKQNNGYNNEYILLNKPDYSKYLTRDNFYPKSYRNDNIIFDKERFTNDDEILFETKTSFRNDRLMKDLYERAFKKCDYQPNLCQFSNNYRNYV